MKVRVRVRVKVTVTVRVRVRVRVRIRVRVSDLAERGANVHVQRQPREAHLARVRVGCRVTG